MVCVTAIPFSYHCVGAAKTSSRRTSSFCAAGMRKCCSAHAEFDARIRARRRILCVPALRGGVSLVAAVRFSSMGPSGPFFCTASDTNTGLFSRNAGLWRITCFKRGSCLDDHSYHCLMTRDSSVRSDALVLPRDGLIRLSPPPAGGFSPGAQAPGAFLLSTPT